MSEFSKEIKQLAAKAEKVTKSDKEATDAEIQVWAKKLAKSAYQTAEVLSFPTDRHYSAFKRWVDKLNLEERK